MKSIISLSLSLLVAFTIQAQQYKLSLSEAIDLGLKNRIALKNQQLTIQLAENETAKTRTKNLPQINATLDARVNTQLQTQVISPVVAGGSASSDPIRAQFGTKYYNVFAINATQNIFNPNVHHDKIINEERTELERLNLKKSEIDVKLSISEAYLDAAYKKVKWEASQFNYRVAHEQLVRGITQFNNGTKLKIDLTKQQLDERNALQSTRNDSSQYFLALRYLVNELTLPSTTTLQLSELAEVEKAPLPVDNTTAENRIELQSEKQQQLVYQLNKQKQNATYLPTVSVFANYTAQQFSKSFDPTNGKLWAPYNYIGLRVELPIFDGLLKKKTSQEFDYRIEQSKNNVLQLNQQIEYEINAAQWELQNAEAIYKLASENYELSKEILKADFVRLEAGTILPVEAKNSEYAMLTAQSNYLNGLYQFLLARIRLQKATGLLN